MQHRMTGAELATRRWALGLTIKELATRLDVRPDTVSRWEAETEPVPLRIPSELDALRTEQIELAHHMIESPQPVTIVRGDGWAMGAAARATELYPVLRIQWPTPNN